MESTAAFMIQPRKRTRQLPSRSTGASNTPQPAGQRPARCSGSSSGAAGGGSSQQLARPSKGGLFFLRRVCNFSCMTTRNGDGRLVYSSRISPATNSARQAVAYNSPCCNSTCTERASLQGKVRNRNCTTPHRLQRRVYNRSCTTRQIVQHTLHNFY